MLNHIEGKISEIVPTHAVIEAGGVGFHVHISLNTYSKIRETDAQVHKLLVHLVVREDAMILYGFSNEEERLLFRHLISVSGVGPNTARMILSARQPSEILEAIVRKDEGLLQSIKGIGAKSAQRIIVELKDKLSKEQFSGEIFQSSHNTNKQEALSALIVLGFSRMQTEKVIDKIITENPDFSAEDLIRNALKIL
jgi:holliday junction DNA helicase RuvA